MKQIPITALHPHPQNPREDLGDLTELAESIKSQGVLQNLTVVDDFPDDGDAASYTVVIGHRRLAAAKIAGLTTLPCTIAKMDEQEQIATMLAENMQRADLTPIEEAWGFQMMMDLGSTVETIARKTGFSKDTVKHRLEIAKLDRETYRQVQAVSEDRQITLAELMLLEKVENVATRNKLLLDIGTHNFRWNVEAEAEKEENARNKDRIVEAVEGWGLPRGLPKGHKSWNHRVITKWRFKDDVKIAEVRLTENQLKQATCYVASSSEVVIYGGLFEGVAVPDPDKDDRRKKDEADFARRVAELDEINVRMYRLRVDFIQQFIRPRCGQKPLIAFRWAQRVLGNQANGSLCDAETLLDVIPGDDETADPERWFVEEYRDKIAGNDPAFKLAVLVYCCLDNPEVTYHRAITWNMSLEHKKLFWRDPNTGALADPLYAYLNDLGYEMSDEERQIVNGTHPLYTPIDGADK
jgi:ParB family chromosome partitioning protein